MLDSVLASTRIKQNKLSEAMEYVGRCLLIRIQKLGVMHEKTADSHFSLGVLYTQLGETENAVKELRICTSTSIRTCSSYLCHLTHRLRYPQ
jgi:lipopolysaccharide biosynthesis regulator YciM